MNYIQVKVFFEIKIIYPSEGLVRVDAIVDCSLDVIHGIISSPADDNGRDPGFLAIQPKYNDRGVSNFVNEY